MVNQFFLLIGIFVPFLSPLFDFTAPPPAPPPDTFEEPLLTSFDPVELF